MPFMIGASVHLEDLYKKESATWTEIDADGRPKAAGAPWVDADYDRMIRRLVGMGMNTVRLGMNSDIVAPLEIGAGATKT